MSNLVAQERDIDSIIRQVTEKIPEVKVEQLSVKFPGDDDNLWWFDVPEAIRTIQVEGEACPFMIETQQQCCGNGYHNALKANTIEEASEMIVSYLRSVQAGQPIKIAGELWWPADKDSS